MSFKPAKGVIVKGCPFLDEIGSHLSQLVLRNKKILCQLLSQPSSRIKVVPTAQVVAVASQLRKDPRIIHMDAC